MMGGRGLDRPAETSMIASGRWMVMVDGGRGAWCRGARVGRE